jgi:putative heme-binding domain-containing protein
LAFKNVPDNKRAYFEKLAGAERLSKNGNDFISLTAPKGPGRNWRMENALPIIEKGLTDRDFDNGKAMYAATTCKMCHSMKGDGGAIGPDLSQLYSRFSSKDMLESIIMPDKTVSDQYAATYYSLKNGSSIVGRLVNEDKTAYYISQNPYAPNELEKVLKKNVISSKPSAASIMFGGLINSLNEDELKDLMAYLMAGGSESNTMFKPKAEVKK